MATDFWKNFTYAVGIIDNIEGSTCIKYVEKTEEKYAYWCDKFEDAQVMHKTHALDIMNGLVCNGYRAFMTPKFKD